MKLIVQRVKNASVKVDDEYTGKISQGLMVLVGFGKGDSERELEYLAKKLVKLRVFPDENGRMNRSVEDINGELLLVPQFTLYASTKKNRPSFHKALEPDKASELFNLFVKMCEDFVHVETGVFGAFMEVSLLNNGPVTITLEKEF